jgi:hypothetical protein
MATARAMLERRRSSRVRTRIPVNVVSPRPASDHSGDDAGKDHTAEVLAVSRTGALLRTSFAPELGSRIELRHGISQEHREFRVVQVSSQKKDGQFELGVEILHPNRNFWGVKFPDEQS